MKDGMRVLIAYDGSAHADAALSDLRRAGLPREAEALLVSVADGLVGAYFPVAEIAGPAAMSRRVTSVVELARERAVMLHAEARESAARARSRVVSSFPGWDVRSAVSEGEGRRGVSGRSSPREVGMAYRGPTLITEPEIRWPLILVAAAITSVIVLVTAGVIHLAATRHYQGRVTEPRLEGAIRRESPAFDELSGLLVVERLVAAEAPHPLNDEAVEIMGTVRNETGRTVTGLELRGVILDALSTPLRERTVVVVPLRQAALEPGEAINVSILLEGVSPEAERAAHLMEVTGVRFD